MKRIQGFLFALALVASTAFVQGQPDLFNATSPAATLNPQIGLNSDLTGTWINRAGYASVYATINVGHARDSVSNVRYAVLEDSTAGAAFALVDSVKFDSTDNVLSRIRYSGTKQFLRVVFRAGGVVRDTAYVNAVILRGNARSR